MGPKLVLVIALLGVASLDWLASAANRAFWLKSAEQVFEVSPSPHLTVTAAESELRRPSLEPKDVAQILAKTPFLEKLDSVPVWRLLDQNNVSTNECFLVRQQYREETCKSLTKPSLKNYCNHLERHFKAYCKENPRLVLEKNAGTELKEGMQAILPEFAALERGESPDKIVYFFLARQDSSGERLKSGCKNFPYIEKHVAPYFGINFRKVVAELKGDPKLRYIYYANLYCDAVAKADIFPSQLHRPKYVERRSRWPAETAAKRPHKRSFIHGLWRRQAV
jgi:hypothetical protein